MKKYIVSLLIAASVVACNNDFLEKKPKTSLTEDNAFETYDNFKAFTFPLYEMFINNTIATSLNNSFAQNGPYLGDVRAGYLTTRFNYNAYAFQTISTASTGNGWNFGYIRRINIMLSNIDGAKQLSSEEKKHWRAVGYFFHAYWYMELTQILR